MTDILVTGAYGQLGQEIKALDAGNPELRLHYHDADTLDITNENALAAFFKRIRPAYLINCAGYTAVDKAESEPEKAFLLNARAPKRMALLCQQYGTRFIHFSTDYVFDGTYCQPYTETDSPAPKTIYGQSKLEGEQAVTSVGNVLIIRTSWLYSPYGHNFVKTIIRLAHEKPGLRVVFDQIGTPTAATDLASTVLNIITSSLDGGKFPEGVFHYSHEGVCSWYDFAREILDLSRISVPLKPVRSEEFPTPALRPFYSVLDKRKIKDELGIVIPHWGDGLRKIMQRLTPSSEINNQKT